MIRLSGRRAAAAAATAVFLSGAVIIFHASTPIQALRGAVVRAALPLARVSGEIGRRTMSRMDTAPGGAASDAPGASEALRAELAGANARIAALERALGLKQRSAPRAIAARVLSYAADDRGEELILDAGEEDGVRVGDAVMDEDALFVGEIAETGDGFSKVSVASNAGSAFSAAFAPPQGSDVLARGLGGRAFSIELVPQDVLVGAGDIVMHTWKGVRSSEPIAVARLTDAGIATGAFKKMRAVLLAHPERLDRVLVAPHP